MGDISDHFSKRDFVCHCKNCRHEFKISLTLVGILEMIRSHFRKRVEILTGHLCEEENSRLGGIKKSYHVLGKAAMIMVLQTPPEEVFQFAERISQVRGLGLDLAKKQIYLDIRDKNERKWIWEGEKEIDLTPELRQKYNLGEALPKFTT
ncbi:D-Ala-D-Ala carboxypeptidase family metallohydrolase [Candidatus Margulisiibacteriota bacterium]